MRRRKPGAEIAQFDREARVIELRAQGHSFKAIADECGFSDPSGAHKAYHRALARKPAQNAEQIRAQEAERLEYLWRECAKAIENPGPRTSAIGKVVRYPEGHEREGELVLDESIRQRAIDNYRKLSESFRKLTGADITQREMQDSESAAFDEMMTWVHSVADANKDLQSENASLRAELAVLRDTVPAQLVPDEPWSAADGLGGHPAH